MMSNDLHHLTSSKYNRLFQMVSSRSVYIDVGVALKNSKDYLVLADILALRLFCLDTAALFRNC